MDKGCRLLNFCVNKHLCCYYCKVQCQLRCTEELTNCRFSKGLSKKVKMQYVRDTAVVLPETMLTNEIPKPQVVYREPIKKDLLRFLKSI